MKVLVIGAMYASFAFGQFSAGMPARTVSKKLLAAITAPGASAAAPDQGQSNHLLMVQLPNATVGVGGFLCRLEASFDQSTWVPISVDVTFAPYVGGKAYVMIRANGVYPAVRANCPTVPGAGQPLDAFYVGSQYPFGDTQLVGDRYLTSAVGSDVSKMGVTGEPTATNGITAGTMFDTYVYPGQVDQQALTDNFDGTLTITNATADNSWYYGSIYSWRGFSVNYTSVPSWGKFVVRFTPWISYNDGNRSQCLALKSQAVSGKQVVLLECYKKETSGDGQYHIAVWGIAGGYGNETENQNLDGDAANPWLAGMPHQYHSAGFGTTPKTSILLQVTQSNGNLTFSYSFDDGATTTVAAVVASTIYNTGSTWSTLGSPVATWNNLGILGNLGGVNGNNTSTAPDSFNIQRFKYY